MASSYVIDGPLSINLGSDANGDVYYRNAGVLQRLAIGSNGQALVLNSGLPSWQTLSGGTTTTFTSINSATYNVLTSDQTVGSLYSSTGSSTVTLPAVTATVQKVTIVDTGGNAATNNITIDVSGGGTINGSTSVLLNQNRMSLTFTSDGSSEWFII